MNPIEHFSNSKESKVVKVIQFPFNIISYGVKGTGNTISLAFRGTGKVLSSGVGAINSFFKSPFV